MIRAAERRAAAALALALAPAFAASPAGAQGGGTSARADALFTQGKAALEAGDFAHACPALQDSYAIDPANGTLLALGVCHEGQGRTATAWRELRSAAEGATKDGRADRAQFAQAHIAKLEGRLSRLTVVVPGDAPSGLGIELDGTPLPQSEWGKASPIDPGHHTIAAHAPGRRPWTGAVDVAPEHDAQTVKVGPLAGDAPASASTPPSAPGADAPPAGVTAPPAGAPPVDTTPTPDTTAPGTWKRPAGSIVGGFGVAALGVGTAFGVTAITKSNDAKSQCSPQSCTSPGAVGENNDAKTAATIADVALGAGLAALAVGAYFLITAPSAPASAPPSALSVAPYVGNGQAGVAFAHAW